MKVVSYTFVFLFIFLAFQTACGQKRTLETMPEVKSPTNSKQQAYPALKIQSDEFVKAMMNNAVVKIVEFTHPKIVNESGGKDEMIKYLTKYPMNLTHLEGYEYESIEIVEIKPIVEAAGELFAVVPVRFNVKSTTGKAFAITSLIGVSADNGANWKFLYGVNQEDFDYSFPKAARKIQIPADRESKAIENE